MAKIVPFTYGPPATFRVVDIAGCDGLPAVSSITEAAYLAQFASRLLGLDCDFGASLTPGRRSEIETAVRAFLQQRGLIP